MKARSLGDILRAGRERIGLTQSQLALRVKIAPNHLSRLESGEKSWPTFDTMARLAAELGLSLDQVAAECGYSIGTKRPKDRVTLAETANDIAGALDTIRAVEKKLTATVSALQRQAGIPAKPPEKRTERKRRT